MNTRLILCLALVLSGIYTALAFALADQIKPSGQNPDSEVLIRAEPESRPGYRDYLVIVLPKNNIANSNLSLGGNLSIYEQSNLVAECPVEGEILSNIRVKERAAMIEQYYAMTNSFKKPLKGAKLFSFQVATNALETSRFTLYNRAEFGGEYSRWFYLKDF